MVIFVIIYNLFNKKYIGQVSFYSANDSQAIVQIEKMACITEAPEMPITPLPAISFFN